MLKDSKKLGIRVSVLAITIFLLNLLAMEFHWYFSVWYFDIIMHFLGGFFVCLALIWLWKKDGISKKDSVLLIVGVFLIGILWELFEIYINEFITGNNLDVPDTITDMIMDLIGGIFAIGYFSKKFIPKALKN